MNTDSVTDEASRSVAKMFDLSLIDLASVFNEIIKNADNKIFSTKWSDTKLLAQMFYEARKLQCQFPTALHPSPYTSSCMYKQPLKRPTISTYCKGNGVLLLLSNTLSKVNGRL